MQSKIGTEPAAAPPWASPIMLLFTCDYAIFYAPIMLNYARNYAPNYADYAPNYADYAHVRAPLYRYFDRVE